ISMASFAPFQQGEEVQQQLADIPPLELLEQSLCHYYEGLRACNDSGCLCSIIYHLLSLKPHSGGRPEPRHIVGLGPYPWSCERKGRNSKGSRQLCGSRLA